MKTKDRFIETVLKQTDHTIESLAELLNVTPHYIKDLKTHKRPIPKKLKIELTKRLNLTIDTMDDSNDQNGFSYDEVKQFLNDEETTLEKDLLMDEEK